MDKPYHYIAPTQDVPLFLFADHASRHIPAEFDNLGLSGDDLTRHIAWDIGTETITRRLAERFGCSAQIAALSRLVIDMNRDPKMDSVIPAESDGTHIAPNAALSDADRAARIARFHTPYHAALDQHLSAFDDPLVISIHSFTPKPEQGEWRKVEIGLLVKDDEETAKRFAAQLSSRHPEHKVGINEPYSAYVLNYTIDANVAGKGFRHLAIEVNQGLLETDAQANVMADKLADCLAPLISGKDQQEGLRHAG